MTVTDPVFEISETVKHLPEGESAAMLSDLRAALEEGGVASFLDCLSDWVATAEIYANPGLKAALDDAIAASEATNL